MSHNPDLARTQGQHRTLRRLSRRAREQAFAAARRITELELIDGLGRAPTDEEIATRLLADPQLGAIADRRDRSVKRLVWRLQPKPRIHSTRELWQLLGALPPELSWARAIILDLLEHRRNYRRHPGFANPSARLRELLAVLRAREQRLEATVQRVAEKLFLFFEQQPLAPAAMPFAEPRIVDVRHQIRATKVDEARGPPRPNADAPTVGIGAPGRLTAACESNRDQSSNVFGSSSGICICATSDLAFAREVEQLCRLGPRAVFELLAQAGRERGARTYLERLVHQYVSRLSAEMLVITGGDRLPAVPIHLIAPDWGRAR